METGTTIGALKDFIETHACLKAGDLFQNIILPIKYTGKTLTMTSQNVGNNCSPSDFCI